MRRPPAILLTLGLALAAAGCSRPPGLFNDQNAHAHLEMLAGTIGSRPVGTSANARARTYIVDQLRLFGYEVRVQDADARRASFGLTARVSNIIAVRPGKRSEAVGLVSHYDSVPMGAGASDNALAVAVSLEAARVLAARSDPNWSVMVLVTDGEEAGLMGAAALVTDREVMRRLHAYINFDSVGRAGSPMLFEAGPGNDWLMRTWQRYAPAPRGGSFVTEIYKRLPNDTDFSVLKLHEIPGLNFAAVRDTYAYHTDRDTPERVPVQTIRKSGEQIVAIAQALDATDITQRTPHERTFFDVGGQSAASLGRLAGTVLAIAALVLGIVSWVKTMATAVRLEGLLRWLFTCLWILLGGAAVVGAMIGTTVALRGASTVYHPWYAYPGRLFMLMLAVGVTVGWSVARLGRWLPARAHGVRHPVVVWSVALPAWIALAGAAAWFVPGAAYLWLVPLFAAGLLLAVIPTANAAAVRLASVIVLGIAGTLWIVNTHDLLHFMVGQLGRTPIVTPSFVYAAMMSLCGVMIVPPLVATIASTHPVLRPSLATTFGLLAIAATAGYAYAAPAYTNEAPLRRYARAIQDGQGPTTWEVGSAEPGLDLGPGAPGGWTTDASALPVSVPFPRLRHPFVFRASGPMAGPLPIGIQAFTVQPLPGGSELTVTVVPHMQGLRVSFVMPAGVEPARSNLPGVQRLDRWVATYVAPPIEGVTFRAGFGPLPQDALRNFRLAVTAVGSPAPGGWKPPAWLPNERTAWTAEATWIVAPFDLPIAPVPPLR